MEELAVFHNHAASSPWIPTSFSLSSLDFSLNCPAATTHSLLSESVTLDSLSTVSSDLLPAFPLCAFPAFSTIALGDNLKMFSPTIPSPVETSTPTPRVVLAAPTSPRIKSMLKECLCITKWAEHSSGKAPGHIPWESIQQEESSGSETKWTPEGSLFSSESFSRVLNLTRACGRQVSQPIVSPPITNASSVNVTQLSRNDQLDLELLEMMRELRYLKSFFEGSLQESESCPDVKAQTEASVPSLVVSTSQFTFPLALESSLSLTQSTPGPLSLACRRGKQPPAALLVRKEFASPDIPYPDIPTAFLGSGGTPSREETQPALKNSSECPSLAIEDMISNLRLQCSKMSPQTPPAVVHDAGLLHSVEAPTDSSAGRPNRDKTKDSEADVWAFASSVKRAPRSLSVKPSTPSNAIWKHAGRSPSPSPNPKPAIRSRSSTTPSSPTSLIPKATVKSPKASHQKKTIQTPPSKPKGQETPVHKPAPLKSAMVNGSPPSTGISPEPGSKPPKSVRFALTRAELARDLIASGELVIPTRNTASWTDATPEHAYRKSSVTARSSLRRPISMPRTVAPSRDPARSSVPVVRNSATRSTTSARVRAHSMAVSSPPRKGSDTLTFVPSSPSSASSDRDTKFTNSPTLPQKSSRFSLDDAKASLGPTTPAIAQPRRPHTLGRHSLSRIMKGPMFSSVRQNPENKRATIAIEKASEMKSGDQVGSRVDAVSQKAQEVSFPEASVKKNRISAPFRNILTRFNK